ncbi:MAG: hypothetical protein AB7E96_12190 [Deferribacterales bacterium]
MSRTTLPTDVISLLGHCAQCRSENKKILKTNDGWTAAFFCDAQYCPAFRDGERPAGVLLTAKQADKIIIR